MQNESMPDEIYSTMCTFLGQHDIGSLACVSSQHNESTKRHWHQLLHNCKDTCDCYQRQYEYLDKTTPLSCMACGIFVSHSDEYTWEMCESCFIEHFDGLISFKENECTLL